MVSFLLIGMTTYISNSAKLIVMRTQCYRKISPMIFYY